MEIFGGEGKVQYKKNTSKYWKTANDLDFIIDDLGTYNIKYSDVNNNSVTQTYIINESNNEINWEVTK